jgi:DNA polymerase (family 10)
VENKSWGAALQYFTGSKEHNVSMRSLAIKNGFKLNEYGLFNKETEKFITGEKEEDIYKNLKLKFIEPELRENRGEIESSLKNNLPNLIQNKDIYGDFHIHSNHSDGINTIQEIVNEAEKLNYKYIGITDHSQSLKIAGGLTHNQIIKKKQEIEKINKTSKIHVFCGTECEIKNDGSLDYPKESLKLFDYVAVGIHHGFKMNKEDATNRILKAMDNPFVTYIAHPTCRMIGHREALNLDLDKIFQKAYETKTYLEINSFPDRLDLNDILIKRASEFKNKFLIGSDSHSIIHLPFIMYGVACARRGWLEKKDILNTHDLSKTIDLIKQNN